MSQHCTVYIMHDEAIKIIYNLVLLLLILYVYLSKTFIVSTFSKMQIKLYTQFVYSDMLSMYFWVLRCVCLLGQVLVCMSLYHWEHICELKCTK